jgi:molybdopterin synthase catalytic subunit
VIRTDAAGVVVNAAAPAVLRRCALRTEPLDVTGLLALTSDRSAGGQALFIGSVRDHDEPCGHTGASINGRRGPVVALEYEAHPGAQDVLQRLALQVAAGPGLRAVVVEHRLGRLTVGEAAVVVAVSADHRGEAFDACRTLIDELKATVPIWKRQTYADGTSDWVGCA